MSQLQRYIPKPRHLKLAIVVMIWGIIAVNSYYLYAAPEQMHSKAPQEISPLLAQMAAKELRLADIKAQAADAKQIALTKVTETSVALPVPTITSEPQIPNLALIQQLPISAGQLTDVVFALPDKHTPEPTIAQPTDFTHNITIQRGDSLARIFSRLNLSGQELHAIMQLDEPVQQLQHLRPGQALSLAISPETTIQALQYELDLTNSVYVQKTADGFTAKLLTTPLAVSVKAASAEIKNSLFVAGKTVGLSDKIIMQMADIYGWDIDFALDIRAGDHFTVLYEEYYKNGNKIADGPILAAAFQHRKHNYITVRYTDENGHTQYYSDTGRSMRKAFLRTPVNFTRISSRFNLQRKHPLLNRIRAHRGVDYAASRGTPVRVTGDGKINFIGNKGGYGKTIIVQHGNKYSTVYAHLSKYSRGLKKGNRVAQGQMIGYVGSTGLATGPHLHYEFRIHGVHYNPLTVSLPDAERIPATKQNDFDNKSRPLLAKLDEIAIAVLAARRNGVPFQTTKVALNDSAPPLSDNTYP